MPPRKQADIPPEWFDAELEQAVEVAPLKRPWSNSELAVIKHYYPILGCPPLAQRMSRSRDSICRMARRLGLHFTGKQPGSKNG